MTELSKSDKHSRYEPIDFEALVSLFQSTHEELQNRADRAVNHSLVVRNWLFGDLVGYEQYRQNRAQNGSGLAQFNRPSLLNWESFIVLAKFPQICWEGTANPDLFGQGTPVGEKSQTLSVKSVIEIESEIEEFGLGRDS